MLIFERKLQNNSRKLNFVWLYRGESLSVPNYHRTQQKDVNNRLNYCQPRGSALNVRENKFCTIIKLWALSADTHFLISLVKFSPVNRNRWVHNILAWRVIWGQHNHINSQTKTRHGKSSAEPPVPNGSVHKKSGVSFNLHSCILQSNSVWLQPKNKWHNHFFCMVTYCLLIRCLCLIWLPHVFICCCFSVDARIQWKSYTAVYSSSLIH